MSRIVRISNGDYKLHVNQSNGTISFNASEIDLNGVVNITGNTNVTGDTHITGSLSSNSVTTTDLTVDNNAIVKNLKVVSNEIDFNTNAKIVYETSSFKLTDNSNNLTSLITGNINAQNVTTTSLVGSPVLVNDSLRIALSSGIAPTTASGITLYSNNGEVHYVYGDNTTDDNYVNDELVSKTKAIFYSMIF